MTLNEGDSNDVSGNFGPIDVVHGNHLHQGSEMDIRKEIAQENEEIIQNIDKSPNPKLLKKESLYTKDVLIT